MYLLVFNVVAALGWAVVLVATVAALPALPAATDAAPATAANALSASLLALLRHVPPTHSHSWSVLAPVQSLAALEVVHVLLGRVRSPLSTTLAQVSSRLILVWAIVARSPASHPSPAYTTMVLAWSLTEVPRYSYYALGLLGVSPPFWLTWLRYSTFYVLYPLGAGSEALLVLSTIPEWQHGLYAAWALEDWVKAAMILFWLPGLYVMYTHMIRIRRKALGPQRARKLGAKPKDGAKSN